MRTQAKIMERTGIVDEGLRRAAVYGRFVDRRVQRFLNDGVVRDMIHKEVDARLEAEIKAIVQRRLDKITNEAERLNPTPKWEVRDILAVASVVTGVSPLDFASPRRARHLAWPRQFACWLVRDLRRDLSLPAIGKIFGNRDHTTIMHACRMTEERREEAPFKQWIEDSRIQALFVESK